MQMYFVSYPIEGIVHLSAICTKKINRDILRLLLVQGHKTNFIDIPERMMDNILDKHISDICFTF